MLYAGALTGCLALMNTASVGAVEQTAAGESLSYIIGPSDELEITVLGYPELSTKTVVLSDGFISFSFLGRIKAAGLNIQSLSRSIQKALDSYTYNPQVTISLLQMRSKRFSVLGEVKKPGVFPLVDLNMTIYEAIAQAEGFLPTAYSKEVHVLRGDDFGKEMVINVDLAETVIGNTKPVSLRLRPGDVVYVPSQSDRSKRFSVLGEVKRPGVFPLEDMNMTIYEAIAQAEGFLPTAYPQQVSILRADGSGQKTSITVDLANTGEGNTEVVSLKLKPGDIVYVPGQSDKRQVCAIGKVMYPGRYNFTPGMTVIDVLTSAGWITKEGVSNSVVLVRRGAGHNEFMCINAQKIISKHDLSQDVLLQPGDIIYVPETFISKLSTFAGFFSSTIEPVAHSYLRVYDAANPANIVVDR